MSRHDADVLVIGAGPAGASVAIRLACAGWRVALMERSAYPRPKVCGECLGPASLRLLHELGVGERVRELAGPEIRRVGWMARSRAVLADMPPCAAGPFRYGRAIGRDLLDALLLERAVELGVRAIQPARARRVHGRPGAFVCEYLFRSTPGRPAACAAGEEEVAAGEAVSASIVIDAHGSWERGAAVDAEEVHERSTRPARSSDLFGFKASFRDAALPAGLLPVLALPGGYGGMVLADRGRTIVACCIRRDALRRWRTRAGCDSAGAAVEAFLRNSCHGVAQVLEGACLEDGWHSIGPLRPGFHAGRFRDVLPVGNAAMEAHPLIGEGICMALESAALLASCLGPRVRHAEERFVRRVRESYLREAHGLFARRLRVAQVYARIAMHPRIAAATGRLMWTWPRILVWGARLAGKAREGTMSVGGAM